MSTHTVTDGQSLEFISRSHGGDPAAVIEASGTCQVSINEFNPRSSRTVDLNMVPGAKISTSFGSVGDVGLTVSGDPTATLVAVGIGANPSGHAVIQADVAGTGFFDFADFTSLEFGRGVGIGVKVFLDGTHLGAATLTLDHPGDFKAAVTFRDSWVVLKGLAEASGYSLWGGMLWLYGADDQVIEALRLNDTSPEQAGLALRLVGSDVWAVEQDGIFAGNPDVLGGAALARHAPPPALLYDGATGVPVTAATAQNLDVVANAPNLFIHGGSGDDAIAAAGGTNVLDGGGGSSFLTAGNGTDTFFVDARADRFAVSWRPRGGHLVHGGEVPRRRRRYAMGRVRRHAPAVGGQPGYCWRDRPHAARGRGRRPHDLAHVGLVHSGRPGERQGRRLVRTRCSGRERLPAPARDVSVHRLSDGRRSSALDGLLPWQ